MKFIAQFKQTILFLKQMNVRIGAFLVSATCSFLAVLVNLSGLQLLIPLAQGIIRNDYSNVRDRAGIIQFMANHFPQIFQDPHYAFFPIATIILSLILVQNLLSYFSNLSITYQTKQAEASIRGTLFSRYLSFGKFYFDKHSSSEANHVILSHASVLAGQLRAYHRLLSQTMSLTAITLLLFFLSWRLTLMTLTLLPIFFISSQWVIRKVKESASQREEHANRIRQRIANIISCIPLVKVYSAEGEEEKLFKKESDLENKLSFDFEKKSLLIKPIEDLNTFLMLIGIAAILSLIRTHEQSQDVSTYLVFFYIVQMAMTRLGVFNEFKIHLARTKHALSQLQKVMDDQGKFTVPGGFREFVSMTNKIEFRNLVFSYPGNQRKVLNKINLTVEKGKVSALIGPTGAGKTTLLSLLLRFYDCPPQSIFIDNQDIRDFNIQSLMRSFAYVSQDILLFDDSLKTNLIYGLDREVTQDEVEAVLTAARLSDFVKALPRGVETHIGERGARLSGGEKQRLSIARALLKKAEILLLDEATSSLDSQTEELIQAALAEAVRDKTTIVIAHRLSTILHADKIAVLKDGMIAEEGNFQQLMKKQGAFFEFCRAQNFDDSLKIFS